MFGALGVLSSIIFAVALMLLLPVSILGPGVFGAKQTRKKMVSKLAVLLLVTFVGANYSPQDNVAKQGVARGKQIVNVSLGKVDVKEELSAPDPAEEEPTEESTPPVATVAPPAPEPEETPEEDPADSDPVIIPAPVVATPDPVAPPVDEDPAVVPAPAPEPEETPEEDPADSDPVIIPAPVVDEVLEDDVNDLNTALL